jgi:hypothetical protein
VAGIGSASQNSGMNIMGGSIDSFSGTLTTASAGRLLSDYFSVIDLTFILDEDYLYSTAIGINAVNDGADNFYRYQLTNDFFQQGFLTNQALNFSKSGMLHAGPYHFELFLNSSHADRQMIATSSMTGNLSFSLTRAAVSVPEGDLPLWLLVAALGCTFLRSQQRY